jgi:protein-tyrosine phosphatase
MIDFHSHVLPELDDGAKDLETSVAMLEESKRQGVTTVVCTPHYYGRKHSPARFLEKRNKAYDLLLPHLPEGMELKLGAEVFFTEDSVLSGEQIAQFCIEGTRYVMLELPFTPKLSERLFERLESFIAETDCIPLIAHVDRYPAVWKDVGIISRLIDLGCLIQLNAEAFTAKGVDKIANVLLKKGMVHAVGTDMHNMGERKPNFSAYTNALKTLSLEAVGESIEKTSAAILETEE